MFRIDNPAYPVNLGNPDSDSIDKAQELIWSILSRYCTWRIPATIEGMKVVLKKISVVKKCQLQIYH
ncbi:hypothetical protein MTBBW1_1010001 [Desulfamplus magnetovallimortis]|uniref:Uncharacterized protein n=1 Tax=Desulfamplus magnetovallimortis TaxID=1246637 RepID=A0A1W1H4P2_9BACT|nr:hypothetical protein MTBBW1_1010001 [Desulfamplus magnetovallimortis]